VRRWIARAATAVIVLIALALGGVWARSYWRLDAFSWMREDGSTRAVLSHHGALHLIQAGTRGRERSMKWDTYRVPRGATHAAVHTQGDLKWQWLGFARIESTLAPLALGGAARVTPLQPAPSTRAASRPVLKLPRDPSIPFMPIAPPPATASSSVVALGGITPWGRVRERPLVPWLNAAPSDALIIPYWPLAAVAGAYAAVIVRRGVRRVLRRRRGHCVACGYDLRGLSATSDRCPECGAPLAPSPAVFRGRGLG